MLNEEQKTKIENLAHEIEDIINVMGNSETTDGLVDNLLFMHRTLVQSFTSKVIIRYVQRMAQNYKNGWYDDRDMAASKACSVMWDALVKMCGLDEEYLKKYRFELPLI
jgi:hypothetical protein